MKKLNRYFDHTMLKPEATSYDIKKLCREALEYDFYSVCVNSSYVSTAYNELKGSYTKISAVVGFPLGAMSTESKSFEADYCCSHGAGEIDMVMNIGAFKEGLYDHVKDDIASVSAICDEYGASVKVILETCLLTDEEIRKACGLAVSAGADFVKTSTGFSSGGATKEHIKLMRDAVGNMAMIKASGGIRDLKTCLEMIEAGADRIGASASVSIMEEYNKGLKIL